MERKTMFVLASLAAGFLIFFVSKGIALGIIFALLWFDKVIIGVFEPLRYLGIDLTTMATVLLALAYGPFFALVFCIIVIPILHAIKHVIIPDMESQWPIFIPSPYDGVNAFGALVAGLVAGWPLIAIMFVTLFAKYAAYAFVDLALYGRPVDFVSAFTNFLFNMLLTLYAGRFFLGLVGIAK